MGITLNDFHADSRTLLLGIDALRKIDTFALQHNDGTHTGNSYLDSANDLHGFIRSNISSLLMWPPSIILYICGRFEYYVRSAIESTADEMTSNVTKYSELPPEMRSNYYKLMMEVISSPKKYGRPESIVNTSLKGISDNLNSDIPQIDSTCLSITTNNMRPDVLNELFKRLAYQDFWQNVGAHTECNARYLTVNPKASMDEAKSELNSIMDIRNAIAHPASTISYPDIATARKTIEYFCMLSNIVDDCCKRVIIKHRSTLIPTTAPAIAAATT
ncbi:MAE_28990/MAE_18760 family HEPN-like nuclease [Deinococcus sp. ME38]|uniref:MAE_28990/MAE_18760 family HEPN-like nuclease n=1 Tax=Deinococcus sp. ME38 TaxID=3400344 RepID=UPI003B5BFE6D